MNVMQMTKREAKIKALINLVLLRVVRVLRLIVENMCSKVSEMMIGMPRDEKDNSAVEVEADKSREERRGTGRGDRARRMGISKMRKGMIISFQKRCMKVNANGADDRS